MNISGEQFLKACEDGNLEVVKNYLDLGGDIEFKDNHISYSNPNGIMISIRYERYDIFTELLDRGVDIHRENIWGETPLSVASLCDDTRFLDELLKRGADINHISGWGGSVLMNVCKSSGSFRNIKNLIDRGADYSYERYGEPGFDCVFVTSRPEVKEELKDYIENLSTYLKPPKT